MGKITETVTTCTCDVCGSTCNENENEIDITFSYSLNDRNYVHGSLYAYIPYGTSNGIVCRECKLLLLEEYITRERCCVNN